MRNKLLIVVISFLLVINTILFTPSLLMAEENNLFNPNFIISDQDLTDWQSMNLADIQNFLNKRQGILKYKIFKDIDGGFRTAAEIIYMASFNYKINPKVILILLQKEQSLLEDPNPTQKQLDWAAGYGVCDACNMQDPNIQKYKGFAAQIDYAAGAMRFYLDKNYGYQVGKLYEIDGKQIIPQNKATAAFYNYTPHYQGNLNFWKLWNKYFAHKYLDGSLLQDKNTGAVWLIKDGQKRPILSKGALLSRFDPNKIIIVDPVELENYPTGSPIKYPEFSLLKAPDNSIYLLVNDHLRKIVSEKVFKKIGFNTDELINISAEEVKTYKKGTDITEKSIYPIGRLLQNKFTGAVFWVQDGKKHPIVTKDILNIKFKNKTIIPVTLKELDKYQDSTPVLLNDGELISPIGSHSVYVIEHQKRRPIQNAEAFIRLGFKWENIKKVSEKTILIHKLGEIIY